MGRSTPMPSPGTSTSGAESGGTSPDPDSEAVSAPGREAKGDGRTVGGRPASRSPRFIPAVVLAEVATGRQPMPQSGTSWEDPSLDLPKGVAMRAGRCASMPGRCGARSVTSPWTPSWLPPRLELALSVVITADKLTWSYWLTDSTSRSRRSECDLMVGHV